MNCPRCGDSFNTFEFRGIDLDKCNKCNGLWFDEGELKKIEKMELTGTDLSKLDVNNHGKLEFNTGSGKCPKCENPLVEINFMYESKIKVDACEVCGGLWLDEGELIEIIKYLSEKGENKEEMAEYMKAYELAAKEGKKTDAHIDNSLAESMLLKFVYGFMSNFKLRK